MFSNPLDHNDSRPSLASATSPARRIVYEQPRSSGAWRRLFHVAPEPTHGVGKDRRAVRAVVRALAEDELIVPPRKLERGRHLLVRERPVAELVIEIVFAVLEEHANLAPQGERFLVVGRGVRRGGNLGFGLADE